MLNTHGKIGLHLILFVLLKCLLHQSHDIQAYSEQNTKEIEKRCIQNSARTKSSLVYAGC